VGTWWSGYLVSQQRRGLAGPEGWGIQGVGSFGGGDPGRVGSAIPHRAGAQQGPKGGDPGGVWIWQSHEELGPGGA
jgi:hypothetical protein